MALLPKRCTDARSRTNGIITEAAFIVLFWGFSQILRLRYYYTPMAESTR